MKCECELLHKWSANWFAKILDRTLLSCWESASIASFFSSFLACFISRSDERLWIAYFATVCQPSSSTPFGTRGSAIVSSHFFSISASVRAQRLRTVSPNLRSSQDPNRKAEKLIAIHVLEVGAALHVVIHFRCLNAREAPLRAPSHRLIPVGRY